MPRRYSRPRAVFPSEVIMVAVLLMCTIMACLLFNLAKAEPGKASKTSQSGQAEAKRKSSNPATQLGSAFLNLDWLSSADSIDESDNARWSLVRGTSGQDEVYSPVSGVDWQSLRTVSQSGSFDLPEGNTWSFNDTFGGGPGYKMASGVLAGGQCALATVFRAAAIQAGLSDRAIPHQWPVPGFSMSETVTIWWGEYDLLLHNTTGQDLSLDWELSPQGIKISIQSFNVD